MTYKGSGTGYLINEHPHGRAACAPPREDDDQVTEHTATRIADSLELAPEPTLPVGERRRSPGGVEVVKTDERVACPWRKYRSSPYRSNPGLAWFTDAEVADWEVISTP